MDWMPQHCTRPIQFVHCAGFCSGVVLAATRSMLTLQIGESDRLECMNCSLQCTTASVTTLSPPPHLLEPQRPAKRGDCVHIFLIRLSRLQCFSLPTFFLGRTCKPVSSTVPTTAPIHGYRVLFHAASQRYTMYIDSSLLMGFLNIAFQRPVVCSHCRDELWFETCTSTPGCSAFYNRCGSHSNCWHLGGTCWHCVNILPFT